MQNVTRISKNSNKVEGNTVKAFVAAAFSIKNTTKHVISMPYDVVKVFIKGEWLTFEWYSTDSEYVFVLAK